MHGDPKGEFGEDYTRVRHPGKIVLPYGTLEVPVDGL